MTGSPRLVARVALFTALIYVLSWGTTFLPNINPIFFLVFSAGYCWGMMPGILTGIIGMGLWTFFNPFGPAPLPVAIAQIAGTAFCGLFGSFFTNVIKPDKLNLRSYVILTFCGLLCSTLFFTGVSAVDAVMFQPFKPRFVSGMLFAAYAILANGIIFPLLFSLLRPFYLRENLIK